MMKGGSCKKSLSGKLICFCTVILFLRICCFFGIVSASTKNSDDLGSTGPENFKINPITKLNLHPGSRNGEELPKSQLYDSSHHSFESCHENENSQVQRKNKLMGSVWAKAPKEARLLVGFLGIFGSFLYWGYLQERITGHKYTSPKDPSLSQQWSYPFFLNTFMACSGFTVGSILQYLTTYSQPTEKPNFKIKDFIKPAASYTLGSPFGYTALRFINFPLLILAKSCKLVPVMLMGIIIAKKKYKKSEYLAVALITVGIALYSMKPGSLTKTGDEHGGLRQFFGLGLVLINLLLDGYTAAHQDKINEQSKVSSFQMMKYMNMWSMIIMVSYLVGSYSLLGKGSELAAALTFCKKFPQVVPHLIRFGLCAATGQIFVYFLIKEFGALAYITVTIMRKFFTILISIAVFKHHVKWWQWIGIISVFGGLVVNVYGKYK